MPFDWSLDIGEILKSLYEDKRRIDMNRVMIKFIEDNWPLYVAVLKEYGVTSEERAKKLWEDFKVKTLNVKNG